MSSITAQIVSGWRVRLTVNVDGIPTTSTISVNRYGGETDAPHPIVGATRIKPAPIVLDDPETPLQGINSWALESYTATGVRQVEDVAILEITTAGRPVLSDPVRQLAVAVVLCADGQDHTMAGRASSVDVAGRATRVWSWDVEAAPTLSPVFITDTPADHATVEDIMSTGDPVLLRTPCTQIPDRWLMRGGDRSWSWLTRRCIARKHALGSCEEMDGPPAGLTLEGVFGDTLGDLDRAAQASTESAGTLAAIWDRWDTLAAIAATDLKATT